MTSCKKFLDEQPVHELVGESAVTNFEKGKAALGGVYSTFQNNQWSGGIYTAFASKSGFVNFAAVDYRMTYTQNAPSSYALGIWKQFYESLNAANFAISGISSLSSESVSDERKKILLAEGRCLRAWIHVNILWNFGHWWGADDDRFGLLYRDQVVGMPNVFQARLTVGESYQKIMEDLDYAIAHGADFESPKYVSKHFAKALKAKILLIRNGNKNDTKTLNDALTLVNDVLNNHPASFAMEEDLNNVYKNSWDSKENLFVRYLENDGNRRNSGGYHYTTFLCQNIGDVLPLRTGAELTARLIYGLDWFKADPRWDVATGPVRAAAIWDETKRHTWKKLTRLGQYAGQQSNDPNAEKYAAYYFRYSELYLMKAELLARTGASVSDAIAPINEMRSKRTAQSFPALTPSSKEELMDMIFKEIFLENFMENGSEFFASVRFFTAGEPWIVTIKGMPLVENKMCWPIPDSEMVNNIKMEQNPE